MPVNSSSELRKTNIALAMSPGMASGRVIVKNALRRLQPRLTAASSRIARSDQVDHCLRRAEHAARGRNGGNKQQSLDEPNTLRILQTSSCQFGFRRQHGLRNWLISSLHPTVDTLLRKQVNAASSQDYPHMASARENLPLFGVRHFCRDCESAHRDFVGDL